MKANKELFFLLILLFITSIVNGQNRYSRNDYKIFQIGLVPGISTNGVNSGSYTNKFSINLFAGYSTSAPTHRVTQSHPVSAYLESLIK